MLARTSASVPTTGERTACITSGREEQWGMHTIILITYRQQSTVVPKLRWYAGNATQPYTTGAKQAPAAPACSMLVHASASMYQHAADPMWQ